MHELAHFKRRDIWFQFLLVFANALHWYNPVIYFMVRQANRDIELSCDEEVVKNKSMDFIKRYGDTILAAIRQKRQNGAVFSTYFSAKKQDIENRLLHIFGVQARRPGRLPLLCSALIVVAAGSLVSSALPVFAQSKLSPAQIVYLQGKYDVHHIPLDQQIALRDELLHFGAISPDQASCMFLAQFPQEGFILLESPGILTTQIGDIPKPAADPNDLLGGLERVNQNQGLQAANIKKTHGRNAGELLEDMEARRRVIEVLRQIERGQ